MSDDNTIDDLNAAMMDIYHRLKTEARYDATYFRDLLSEVGGLNTAKNLFAKSEPTEGLRAIAALEHLDLTVEALVLSTPRFQALFDPPELQKASDRLKQFNYTLTTR